MKFKDMKVNDIVRVDARIKDRVIIPSLAGSFIRCFGDNMYHQLHDSSNMAFEVDQAVHELEVYPIIQLYGLKAILDSDMTSVEIKKEIDKRGLLYESIDEYTFKRLEHRLFGGDLTYDEYYDKDNVNYPFTYRIGQLIVCQDGQLRRIVGRYMIHKGYETCIVKNNEDNSTYGIYDRSTKPSSCDGRVCGTSHEYTYSKNVLKGEFGNRYDMFVNKCRELGIKPDDDIWTQVYPRTPIQLILLEAMGGKYYEKWLSLQEAQ